MTIQILVLRFAADCSVDIQTTIAERMLGTFSRVVKIVFAIDSANTWCSIDR